MTEPADAALRAKVPEALALDVTALLGGVGKTMPEEGGPFIVVDTEGAADGGVKFAV